MTPLRVGLVGFGLAGRYFHAPFLRAVPDLDLVAVVTSRRDEVAAFDPAAQVFASFEALLDADLDLDLLVLATPNAFHAPYAQQALARGWHVVIDKPFTVTTAEADALVAQANAAGRLVSPYHNRRFDSGVQTLRRLLDAGTLGRVHTLEARFDRFRPDVPMRWRDQPGPGAGILYDLGPHLLDLALTVFGPPQSVWADVRTLRTGALVDDDFQIVLTYADGRRADLRAGTLMAAAPFHLAAFGDQGSYVHPVVDGQEDRLRAHDGDPRDADWGVEPETAWGTLTTVQADGTPRVERVQPEPGQYQRYYDAIAQAIRTGSAPPVTAQDGRTVIALLEAAQASSAARQSVGFGS